MDFTTNYCGPYWSDGKFQPSVENGSNAPVSDLDAACQRHDAAYARAKTRKDLDVADTKFYHEAGATGLKGKLYGHIVSYFNKLSRGVDMNSKSDLVEKQLEWLHRGNLRADTKPNGGTKTNANQPASGDQSGGTIVVPPHVVDLRSGEMPDSQGLPSRYFPFRPTVKRRRSHRKQKHNGTRKENQGGHASSK